MKRINSILFFILFLSLTSNAQDERLRVQVGGVFDLQQDIDGQLVNVSKGLNLGVEYFLSKKLSINSTYTHFQKIEGQYFLSSKWINTASTVDLNARYYFIQKRM